MFASSLTISLPSLLLLQAYFPVSLHASLDAFTIEIDRIPRFLYLPSHSSPEDIPIHPSIDRLKGSLLMKGHELFEERDEQIAEGPEDDETHSSESEYK